MDLSGIFPALTTPYANDGSVSLPDLKHNIQRYNGTDLAGYVVLGSTGESVLLRQAAESRELLGPHLGLYQIHSATRESGVLILPATISAILP